MVRPPRPPSPRWTPYAALIATAVFTACTANPPVGNAEVDTFSTTADTSFLTLGPSDLVVVQVLGHPSLSTSVEGELVDPQGNLFLPLIGRISVLDRTVAELNEALALAFRDYMKDPDVTATILKYGSRAFHVMGHVSLPGMKTMDRPFNALEAVAQGGAMKPGADRQSIFLLRPHADTVEVHRFNAATPGPDGFVRVLPGDIVYVRTKGTQEFQEDIIPMLNAFGLHAFALATLAND